MTSSLARRLPIRQLISIEWIKFYLDPSVWTRHIIRRFIKFHVIYQIIKWTRSQIFRRFTPFQVSYFILQQKKSKNWWHNWNIVEIPRLTSPFPCLNRLMTWLLVVSPSSSICQISMTVSNARAIRFLEIHSTFWKSLLKTFRSNEWKSFAFVASPFARVFHNDNFWKYNKNRK